MGGEGLLEDLFVIAPVSVVSDPLCVNSVSPKDEQRCFLTKDISVCRLEWRKRSLMSKIKVSINEKGRVRRQVQMS